MFCSAFFCKKEKHQSCHITIKKIKGLCLFFFPQLNVVIYVLLVYFKLEMYLDNIMNELKYNIINAKLCLSIYKYCIIIYYIYICTIYYIILILLYAHGLITP